jgi:hypothetical protein
VSCDQSGACGYCLMTRQVACKPSKLPPGPAFIRHPRRLPWPYESHGQWALENVPEGYRYQSATDHTAAGWVRPHGVKA